MKRKRLALILGVVLGLPVIIGGTILFRIPATIQQSAQFTRHAVTVLCQPWTESRLDAFLSPASFNRGKDFKKVMAGASKKYGAVRRFKMGGASPSTTSDNNQRRMTVSYNVYAECDKARAVVGLEVMEEGDKWIIRNLNVREPAPFEENSF
ncbi:MAG: hypothetical protein ACAH95_09660 [Fimbriimonas sp.]